VGIVMGIGKGNVLDENIGISDMPNAVVGMTFGPGMYDCNGRCVEGCNGGGKLRLRFE